MPTPRQTRAQAVVETVDGRLVPSTDQWQADPRAVRVLLKHVAFRGPVWEPACGRGVTADLLKEAGHAVLATDLYKLGYADQSPVVSDFLKTHTLPVHPGTGETVRSIVTLPPHADNLPEAFARHGLILTQRVDGQVAILARHDWDVASSRLYLLRHPAFACKVMIDGRLSWGGVTGVGPPSAYAWYLWDHQHKGRPTIIV